MQILPHYVQFPDTSWGLTVLKNFFLRFLGLKGLKMVWEKVPWFEIFFRDFGGTPPVFPWFPWLEKVFKIFPEFPYRWEPWSESMLQQFCDNASYSVTENNGVAPEWDCNPFLSEWLHCFQWEVYYQCHCRVVTALTPTLGVNGP